MVDNTNETDEDLNSTVEIIGKRRVYLSGQGEGPHYEPIIEIGENATFEDLLNKVNEIYARGENIAIIRHDGLSLDDLDNANSVEELLASRFPEMLPEDHPIKVASNKVNDFYREYLKNEVPQDWDQPELPQDIADRAAELQVELEELLEKGDIKAFLEKFEEAATELSDMSADDTTEFWRDALEGRLGDKLPEPISQIQQNTSDKDMNWQDVSYLQPATLNRESTRLAMSDQFASKAPNPVKPNNELVTSNDYKAEQPTTLS